MRGLFAFALRVYIEKVEVFFDISIFTHNPESYILYHDLSTFSTVYMPHSKTRFVKFCSFCGDSFVVLNAFFVFLRGVSVICDGLCLIKY